MKSKSRQAPLALASLVLIACVSMVACAPKGASEMPSTGGDDAAAEVSVDWSYDSSCETCHTKEPASIDDASCLVSTHAAQGNTCQTCHADEAALKTAHEGATAEDAEKRATKLRSTTVDEATCLSCHGSLEVLAEKTASSAALTDSEGKTVNPHAMPENEDHAETNCVSCHSMHEGTPAVETASEYCESCHHANVYACHTCHD